MEEDGTYLEFFDYIPQTIQVARYEGHDVALFSHRQIHNQNEVVLDVLCGPRKLHHRTIGAQSEPAMYTSLTQYLSKTTSSTHCLRPPPQTYTHNMHLNSTSIQRKN